MSTFRPPPGPRDVRSTATFRNASDLYATIYRPGLGLVADATDLHASPDGRQAVLAGQIFDDLEGAIRTRICHLDLSTGALRALTAGPGTDWRPKFSPGGQLVAFLSDRGSAGNSQLHLIDPRTGRTRVGPEVEGWVEYLHWSPNGGRILLGVAERGADVAGAHGAITRNAAPGDGAAWRPTVEDSLSPGGGRSAWIYDLGADRARRVGAAGRNVWEAVWCGNDQLAAVVSSGAGEGHWYGAKLAVLDSANGRWREILDPADQLGWPAGSPSGRRLAVVEAVCSDRWIVAGDLRLIDIVTGDIRMLDSGGVDVTYTEWRSEQKLLVAGHRGLETVVGLCDVGSGTFSEVWTSTEISTEGRYVAVSGLGDAGDCLMIGEGFHRAPEVAAIRQGRYETLISLDRGYGEQASAIAAVDTVRWPAPDGLEIEGWLLRPKGEGPFPLVMQVHGGPILLWRPMALSRSRDVPLLMLLQRGYAVFMPNPRGSSGRGQDFARQVIGDMGGADARDLLAGLDHLVAAGVADPARLGVAGVSYGGFMTCSLITQDPRFAAATPVAPMTNFMTEQLMSNIPHFVRMFLGQPEDFDAAAYFGASPIFRADRVRTPTLNICGELDRRTPAAEAIQFHRALLDHGAVSALVRYPEEGHGIRGFPAAIDFAARTTEWFEVFMPADWANKEDAR